MGAGASQNHVHCHAWPNPPVAATAYAAEAAAALASDAFETYVLRGADGAAYGSVQSEGHRLDAALLDYPCACVRLRSQDPLLLGKGLGAVVAALQGDELPHNVCALGGDVYVFARRRERAPGLPSRLGASEMMGTFHCASRSELDAAATPGAMAEALAAVSAPREATWATALAALARDLH